MLKIRHAIKTVALAVLIIAALTALLWIASVQYFYTSAQQNFVDSAGPGKQGQQGMVVSAHPLASEIGVQVMRNGGNAFDAAVAVNFALSVVYPQAGNIGGGGFLLYRMAEGEVGALDFRERAPLASDRDMFLDNNGNVIPGLSLTGRLASGVPGAVDGMARLHTRLGQAPWAQLLKPSVALARDGYELSEDAALELNKYQREFAERNRFQTAFSRAGGWSTGSLLKQPELAATLQRIADKGRDGFYRGTTARLLLEEMAAGAGVIAQRDLDAYESVWREPVTGEYRGYGVISMPLPSSGGIALMQLLTGAELFDFSQLRHNSAQHIHLMTELQRRVYADRAEWLGDSDYVEVNVPRLLSKDYLLPRMSAISTSEKTNSQDVKAGHVSSIESFETTHFSIVDPWGNAVAVTTSLNGYFGSKIAVKGAGFLLNNTMDDFSIKPGVANAFGLVGNENNAVAPGKRMLSSMTPTIITRNNELYMVVGSPGGSTIINTVFQVISNVVDFGMTLQEAVNAKKTHSQWLPDHIVIEKGAVSAPDLGAMLMQGHRPLIWPVFDWPLGRVNAIRVLQSGALEAGVDPRGADNSAAIY